jgi:hypothetical protein
VVFFRGYIKKKCHFGVAIIEMTYEGREQSEKIKGEEW